MLYKIGVKQFAAVVVQEVIKVHFFAQMATIDAWKHHVVPKPDGGCDHLMVMGFFLGRGR